ncbi:hypothetical protein K438DRAFT_1004067 [Mycena galopus ATCC 62051]|nr:hypothetical protein K438DRAFT_1004067 [Mycena galopus ATCC 62051]
MSSPLSEWVGWVLSWVHLMDATVSDPSILTPRSKTIRCPRRRRRRCQPRCRNLVRKSKKYFKQRHNTPFSFNFVLHLFRSRLQLKPTISALCSRNGAAKGLA